MDILAEAKTTLIVTWVKHVIFLYPLPIIFAVILLHMLRNKFKPHLRAIPGPPLAAYSRLWRAWDTSKGQCVYTFLDIHRKYGSIVRIGPSVLSLADPSWIPLIYNTKETFRKTGFYPVQDIIYKKQNEPNLFSAVDPDMHRSDKRRVGSAYSLPILLENELAFDQNLDLFIEKMTNFSASGEGFDLGAWLQYFAFDVVGQVSFGRRFGFLEKGQDIDNIIKGITGGLVYFSVVGQIPELHRFLLGNPILRFLTPSMEKTNAVLAFTLKAIRERASILPNGDITGTDQTAKDMLSRWALVSSEDSLKMKTRDIVVHLSTNVLAGSDTTAIALRSILSHLCLNPNWMNRVVAEIQQADSNRLLSKNITYRESVQHLPVVHATIKEGMRLHPSTSLMSERVVPPEGIQLDEFYIPGGTIVGMNAWVTARDESTFYDAHGYHPERWLDASPDDLKQMENVLEFNFGAGSRKCIGRNISIIEMAKIIPQFLRLFSVEMVHPHKPLRVESFSLAYQKGMICRVKLREKQGSSFIG